VRTDQLKQGLTAPICLTWELTYGCNLACVHCLSSSGRRDPDELSTAEAERVVDELAAMQVFYVNIGGGEPLVRRDFLDLLEHAVANGVGVKFSTNGALLTRAMAARLAATDYVDVQVSLDGASEPSNDAVRGAGSYTAARRAMDHLAEAGFGPFKISVVVTRDNVAELDDLEALAQGYGAQLRVTRLRPSRRGDLAQAAPDGQPAAPPVPLAVGPPARPHRRLVLPPVRPWRRSATTPANSAPATRTGPRATPASA
jgi:mycofactocin biosynthetic radical S-adenosylmethionine protein MftC